MYNTSTMHIKIENKADDILVCQSTYIFSDSDVFCWHLINM